MASPNRPLSRRAASPVIAASVTARAPALADPPLRAPLTAPLAAPIAVPPLPLAGERGKPHWPRNEADLDLPDQPPPWRAESRLDAPAYLGSFRARLRDDLDPLDLEVRLPLDLTGVELGALRLDVVNARRLWRLLRVAVAVLGCGMPVPEEDA